MKISGLPFSQAVSEQAGFSSLLQPDIVLRDWGHKTNRTDPLWNDQLAGEPHPSHLHDLFSVRHFTKARPGVIETSAGSFSFSEPASTSNSTEWDLQRYVVRPGPKEVVRMVFRPARGLPRGGGKSISISTFTLSSSFLPTTRVAAAGAVTPRGGGKSISISTFTLSASFLCTTHVAAAGAVTVATELSSAPAGGTRWLQISRTRRK